MRAWLPGTFLLLAATIPAASGAQATGAPAILSGAFVLDGAVESGRARVLTAFEPQIAMLPYFVQDLVRDRLEERLGVPRRITLEVPTDPAGAVRVTYEGERTVTMAAPIGGSTTVTAADGRTVPVSHRLNGGWFEQHFVGENGTLTVLLSTEPDGRTLHADATIRGDRLGGAVPVRLDYLRE